MLRAVRFAVQLGFAIDTQTWEAIVSLKDRLSHISAERIREELTRLLASTHIDKIMLLESSGLLPYVLMGQPFTGDLNDIIAQFRHYPDNMPLRLTLFFSWAGDGAAALMRTLRFDNKTVKNIGILITSLPDPVPHDRYEIKKLMGHISPELVKYLLLLQNAGESIKTVDDIIKKGECFTLRGLAVNGKDLMEAGVKPGKEMGELLKKLLETAMRNPDINNRESLKAMLGGLV
jgi:tRNA nucleotidyltransferase (CCA-adding enzyme)